MAGEWLKFEKSTLDKPEVLAVASALNWDADMAVGKFVRMWCWFDTHTVNGDARGVTPALLDSILRVTGFVAEAQKAGWLEVHEWGIRLPKFDTHCGETAKQRALGAKRNATYRASNAKGDAPIVTDASPREEKKREEKKKEANTGTADAGAGQGATRAENCPQAQIIALYHELLPELPPAREWTDANAAQLRARWRSAPERQSLDWWRKFFGYIHESDFLMGRKTDFQASLDWLVKASNFAKVVNGNYENRGNA